MSFDELLEKLRIDLDARNKGPDVDIDLIQNPRSCRLQIGDIVRISVDGQPDRGWGNAKNREQGTVEVISDGLIHVQLEHSNQKSLWKGLRHEFLFVRRPRHDAPFKLGDVVVGTSNRYKHTGIGSVCRVVNLMPRSGKMTVEIIKPSSDMKGQVGYHWDVEIKCFALKDGENEDFVHLLRRAT